MKSKRETRQRAAVLGVLRSLKNHPTAAELHALVRKQVPRISLGTVYRNLDALANQGTIRRLVSGRCEARFDADLSGHYHVRCAGCGCVGDVPGLASLDIDLADVRRRSGFEVLDHHLEFVGVCPQCARRGCSRAGGMSKPETTGRNPTGPEH